MQRLDYNEIWDGICNQVKSYEEVDAKQVVAFFSRLHLQAFSMGFILLTADNEFIKSWIEKNYITLISRALVDIYGQEFMVEIVVDEAGAPAVPAPAPVARPTEPATPPATVPTTPVIPQPMPAPAPELADEPKPDQPESGTETAVTTAGKAAPTDEESAASPAQTPITAGTEDTRSAANGVPETNTAPAATPAEPAAAPGEKELPSSLIMAMERAREASRAAEAAEPRPARTAPPKPAASRPQPVAEPPSQADNHLTRPVSNLTFSNYVIGNSNRMAYEMALAVADKPGQPQLNPLFIYGKSGVGKTHLLRAIQNHINETFNKNGTVLKTVYVDSTEFINDYANASADHSQEKSSFKNFKKNYENADVLLIDDVQSFQGKTQTLEIIFELFNSLTSAGKQVVMSADIAPKNIDIDERYTSRFNQGATFDIQAPEVETKQAIVAAFIQEYRDKEQFTGDIPADVQEYIAENSSANIRELKSAVTKVIYEMIYNHRDRIDVDDVSRLLANHFSGGKTKRLTAADIQREVEAFYQVSHADLISKKRSRSIAYPRQMGMYLCRQLLDNNAYQRIGDEFGKKDHTTVMHSVGLIETKAKENKEVREEIDILIKRIREQ